MWLVNMKNYFHPRDNPKTADSKRQFCTFKIAQIFVFMWN